MKRPKITTEQFAQQSFRRDLRDGVFEDEPLVRTWADLDYDTRAGYFDEAECYLAEQSYDWPRDIEVSSDE